MFIHPTKTEVMFMSKTPFIGPLRPITYESKLINYVSRSSCLGVTLDNKLSWSPHINQSPAPLMLRTPSLDRWRLLTDQLWNLSTSKLSYPAPLIAFLYGDHHTCSLSSRTRISELRDWYITQVHLSLNTKYSTRPNGTLYLIYIRKDWLVLFTRLAISKHHLV